MWVVGFVFTVAVWVFCFVSIYNGHTCVDVTGRDEDFMGDFTKVEYREFCKSPQRMPVPKSCQGTVKG